MAKSKAVIPIVHFSHANLIEADNFSARLEFKKTEQQNTSDLKLFTDDASSRKRLKLTVQDKEMTYNGLEEETCPFLLGFIPDGSESISIKDSAYFVLKPDCFYASEDTENHREKLTTTYSEKLNSLTAAFGSSKKRRAMQSKLKNQIDSEALEEAVSEAVKDSFLQNESKNDATAAESSSNNPNEQFSVLPTPNTSAKLPQECYSLLDVFGVSQEEIDRFTSDSALLFAETKVETIHEWLKTKNYSEFVCHRLLKLSSSKLGHQQRINKFKLLSLMQYLISMFRLKQNELKNKNALVSHHVPDGMIKKLYEMYTATANNRVHTIPTRLRDKLTAHILILGLHIDDFSTDFRFFQKDLKISNARLVDFYLALGCHIKSQIELDDNKKVMVKIAQLKLPLQINDKRK